MTDFGHIRLDDTAANSGRRSAVLEHGGSRSELWFERPGHALGSTVADPFLLGSLLSWMRTGVDVHVHGPVSRRLLAGLTEWQAAWSLWRPDRYRAVEITADEVVDAHPLRTEAVAAFSGGVDAAYTVRRHLTGEAGWQTADLSAGLLVHGFDIPLDQPDTFQRAVERAGRMLAGTDLELITVRTNLRDLGQDWEDGFALAVAACLGLVADDYGVGLIGSSEPYDHLVLPWGSNPVTDHLTSTGSMDIRHDGAGVSRSGKVMLLAQWPEAREHLRVCWQGEARDRNCGQCEKCVRTILNFRAVGAGLPACFDVDAPDELVRSRRLPSDAVLAEWQSIIGVAEQNGVGGSWTRAARSAVRRERLRRGMNRRPVVRSSVHALRRLLRR